jgi:hypothetical protein
MIPPLESRLGLDARLPHAWNAPRSQQLHFIHKKQQTAELVPGNSGKEMRLPAIVPLKSEKGTINFRAWPVMPPQVAKALPLAQGCWLYRLRKISIL